MMTDVDADGFAAWVESVRWKFASTMPWVPHEYTVNAWSDPEAFQDAARFIRHNGFLARWQHHRPKPYYELDGKIYWAFITVINRAVTGSEGNEVVRV